MAQGNATVHVVLFTTCNMEDKCRGAILIVVVLMMQVLRRIQSTDESETERLIQASGREYEVTATCKVLTKQSCDRNAKPEGCI